MSARLQRHGGRLSARIRYYSHGKLFALEKYSSDKFSDSALCPKIFPRQKKTNYGILLLTWERVVVINRRRACAARVTVVVVSVCLSVCVWVILSVKSHLTSGASVRRENAATYSACNEGQKVFGVFFETASFQSYGTSRIVRLPCSRPFLGGIRACASKMPR